MNDQFPLLETFLVEQFGLSSDDQLLYIPVDRARKEYKVDSTRRKTFYASELYWAVDLYNKMYIFRYRSSEISPTADHKTLLNWFFDESRKKADSIYCHTNNLFNINKGQDATADILYAIFRTVEVELAKDNKLAGTLKKSTITRYLNSIESYLDLPIETVKL